MIFKISDLYDNSNPCNDYFGLLRDAIICRIPFKIKVDVNPFPNEDDLAFDILLSTPDENDIPYREHFSKLKDGGLLMVTSDCAKADYIKTLFI